MKFKIEFTHDIMVFVDKFGRIKYSPTNKDINGEWQYANDSIIMKFKGDEPKHKDIIEIKNAFMDFYNWEHDGKKGTTYYIFVLDYIIKEPKKK